jgi:2-polyprenyl-6-methoxyphenol hydroxylase-like FAD-dependent oxidoreductase
MTNSAFGLCMYVHTHTYTVHVQMHTHTYKHRTMDADVLVGADGIWSSIRAQMWEQDARGPKSGTTYSGYTCFAGDTIQRTPFYFDVGYQVRQSLQ